MVIQRERPEVVDSDSGPNFETGKVSGAIQLQYSMALEPCQVAGVDALESPHLWALIADAHAKSARTRDPRHTLVAGSALRMVSEIGGRR